MSSKGRTSDFDSLNVSSILAVPANNYIGNSFNGRTTVSKTVDVSSILTFPANLGL